MTTGLTLTQQRQQGVTLAEALISVAVLAFLAASLVPLIHGTARATTRVEQASLDREQLRVTRVAITTALGNLVWPDPDTPPDLKGAQNLLQFSSYGAGAVPRKYTLEIKNDQLTADSTGWLPKDKTQHSEILLKNVNQLQVSYYGAKTSVKNQDALPSWHLTWHDPQPPLMLRLEGLMPMPGNTYEPFIMDIAIASRGPLTCPYDPVSRTCRSGS